MPEVSDFTAPLFLLSAIFAGVAYTIHRALVRDQAADRAEEAKKQARMAALCGRSCRADD